MKLRNKGTGIGGEIRDAILDTLLYFGLILAFILPILLVKSIINQITYGDWTCTFKKCIVVKGGEDA